MHILEVTDSYILKKAPVYGWLSCTVLNIIIKLLEAFVPEVQ